MNDAKTGAATAPTELKAALLGFVSELKGYRQDIQQKLDAQDERMSMFERKTALRGRAPLSIEANVDAPHQKAFNAYVRRGDEAEMRGLSIEEKALTTADGGFAAAPQIVQAVNQSLFNTASLRAIANVVQVESARYDVLVDKGEVSAMWVGENSVTEAANTTTERVTINLLELAAMPKASQRMLDDAAFDVEAWLAERIADKFARAESAAFIGGGMSAPQGIISKASDTANGTEIDSFAVLKTGVSGKFPVANPGDIMIELVYSLPAEYRSNATFVMNSKTASALRKLKDADGRYLWADSLQAGEPARLLGYPVLTVEAMPDIAANSISVLFGDFKAAYTIAERPELRILRDPYSAKPHVLFYATKRIGGGLVDGRAMKGLKFGA